MSDASRVTIGKAKRIIRKVAEMKKDINIPLMIWGRHGVGKTQLVKQVADEIDYNSVILNLANQTPEDLLGQINGKGGYHRPGWLVQNNSRPTIYFLDELNRGPKYILQCMFNFINEGRIHEHKIGENDLVLSACNPPEKEYEVTEFEDSAFWSRFCHMRVIPDKNEFTNYIGGRIKNNIIQLSLENSKVLFKNDAFEVPFKLESDNRNLEKVGFLFDYLNDAELEDFGIDIISGLVGYDAASIILETWRSNKKEKINIEEVLTAKKFKFGEKDVEIINKINVFLVDYLRERKDNADKIPDEIFEGFVRYLHFIPRDIQVALLKQITQADMFPMVIGKLNTAETDYCYKLVDTGKDSGKKKN